MDSLYTIELFNFLRTVHIKSSFIAEQVSSVIRNKYKLDTLIDEENPYYLNMCGEYSKYDSPIYVESIDTNSTIVFSKENLLLHPKTAEKYRLPNKKFDELCSLYENQKHLIESIVYPITDLSKAINAKNFDILGYDASFLQSNEKDSLIQALYDAVSYFKNNFFIEEFFYENTYPIVMWDFLWKYLYFSLYKQRIKNIKTSNVHMYHIWSYLTSKGLTDYRSILTIEQQYWLYKNIDYLMKNRGKNKNLQLLAENILSTYSVELKQKSVFLNYKEGLSIPDPIPEIISEDIYTKTNPTQNMGLKYESLPYLIQRETENNLRPINDIDVVNRAHNIFTRSFSTYHPTRVIEINKKNIWTEYESLYIRFILENYLYRFKEGDINYKISIELSTIGSGKLFTVGECYALYNYCLHLQNSRNSHLTIDPSKVIQNEELSNLPKLPINIPTSSYVDTVFVKNCNPKNMSMTFRNIKYVNIEKQLKELITIPNITFSNPNKFMEFLEEKFNILYKTSLEQRSLADEFFYAAFENTYKPFILKGRMDVTFVEGYTTYEEWFNSSLELKNIIESLLKTTDMELEYFMVGLIEKVFPSDSIFNIVKSKTLLNDKYLKLKNLFIKLCSYNISFLDTRDDEDIDFLTQANTNHNINDITNNYDIIMSTAVDIENKLTITVEPEDYKDLSSKIFENIPVSLIENDYNYNKETFINSGEVIVHSIRNDLQMDTTADYVIEDFMEITSINTIESLDDL